METRGRVIFLQPDGNWTDSSRTVWTCESSRITVFGDEDIVRGVMVLSDERMTEGDAEIRKDGDRLSIRPSGGQNWLPFPCIPAMRAFTEPVFKLSDTVYLRYEKI